MSDLPMLVVNNEQSDVTISLDIEAFSIQVCTHLNLIFDHLEITLLSSHAIQKMNFDYFKQDVPTDTISFNLAPDGAITGDVYICPVVVLNNSKQYASDFDKELKIVLIHSLLHLAGYNDNTPETSSEMIALQDKIYLELSQ